MGKVGPLRTRGQDFAGLVYTMLITNKEYSIEEVARGLGMSYATLHSRLINRTCFSADEIRRLVQVAPNVRLVTYLLEPSRFIAADRVDGQPGSVPENIHRGATQVVVNAAGLLSAIDEAMADLKIDHREAADILREIEFARRTLASLKLRIENAGADGAG